MSKMEELITAIHAMNPYGKSPEAALRLYSVLWSAACHQTERCATYYQDDGSPEGTLYRLLGEVFHEGTKAPE